MSKKKKLTQFIRRYETPAKDPEFIRGGLPYYLETGWYYQPENELGNWVFLGRDFDQAIEEYKIMRGVLD